MKGQGYRWLITGGGTGGHLFPGIAVAQELQRLFVPSEVLFVVSQRPIETQILGRYAFPLETIKVGALKGGGWRKRAATLAGIPRSLSQAAAVLRRFRPGAVLGMGGYSAGPVCLAARLMGIPTAIHEQNAYPGLTNRLLARLVDQVYVSFQGSETFLKARSVVWTGNPVRAEFFAPDTGERATAPAQTLLVAGGSQGARAINRVFVEALTRLRREGLALKVIHQTGALDHEAMVAAYRQAAQEGVVTAFIQEMAAAYRQADLVISRAGATTIFEIAAAGRPSILIPYPFAANDHQVLNAESLVTAGAAEMIREADLSPETLAARIGELVRDPQRRRGMGARARTLARPDAAGRIAAHLYALAFPERAAMPGGRESAPVNGSSVEV